MDAYTVTAQACFVCMVSEVGATRALLYLYMAQCCPALCAALPCLRCGCSIFTSQRQRVHCCMALDFGN